MIGTKFTYQDREFTIQSKVEGKRSYICASVAGDAIELSTRALNKLLGRTTPKPTQPLGEDAAAIQILSILQDLEDELACVRIVRDLAIKYLEVTPVIGEISQDEHSTAP